MGPGPYLVLPFLPPLTGHDGPGFGIDRALDLELCEGCEESTLDLYAAVRSAYLERRRKAIADALKERR